MEHVAIPFIERGIREHERRQGAENQQNAAARTVSGERFERRHQNAESLLPGIGVLGGILLSFKRSHHRVIVFRTRAPYDATTRSGKQLNRMRTMVLINFEPQARCVVLRHGLVDDPIEKDLTFWCDATGLGVIRPCNGYAVERCLLE